MLSLRRVQRAFLICLAMSFAGIVSGQEATEPAAPPQSAQQEPTVESIERLRQEAEQPSDLDDDTKEKIADLYRSALADVQRASELAARAVEFKKDTDLVQQRAQQLREQLESIKGQEPAPPKSASLQELEQVVAKLQFRLGELQKAKSAAEIEPAARTKRRPEIRAALASSAEKAAELATQLEVPSGNESPMLVAARRTELLARQLVLKREIPALEAEIVKYDAEETANLVRLQRDLRTQEVALAEQELKLLSELVKSARADAAQHAVHKANDEAVAVDPVLRSYSDRNKQLAEAAQSLTRLIDEAEKASKKSKQTYETLRRKFEQTKKKDNIVGLNSSVGALLRKQRTTLPNLSQWRADIRDRRVTINEAQYELLEYDDERQELANPEAIVRKVIANASSRQGTDEREDLEAAAREVLDRQREYLDALTRNYNTYFDTLVRLDTTERQIIKLTEQYQQYIDQRVLWIRSGGLLSSQLQLDQSDAWLVSGDRWSTVSSGLWTDVRANPVTYAILLIVFGLLVLNGRRLHRELHEISETVQRAAFYRFGPTIRAAGITVILAICLPGMMGFLAWRLDVISNDTAFVKAVSQGLWHVCLAWFPLELVRQICHPQGLGNAHFQWPVSANDLLRRNLRWLIVLELPLIFITSTLAANDPAHGRDAIERICFISAAVVLVVFLRRLLRPRGRVFQEYIAYHQGGWIDKLKTVWYGLGVFLPLSLAGLAFWGYYYTAQVLSWRLYATLCFIVSLVLARAMLRRLIVLRHRKLSIQQAQKRAADATRPSTEGVGSESSTIPVQEPHADVSTHSAQTQRMLGTGMLIASLIGFWLIWVDVLPALSMLDRWPLWTTTVQVTENVPADNGVTSRVVEQLKVITIVNVGFAVMIVGVTFIMARNIPGVLEMLLLQRLPLEASVCYAITTITSYVIVMGGVIFACSSIGLRWSQIQWLATALTFGLAFGLQEMFANFVAGLIILFERPIRVGDVVTVDDVTGVVSRIRIRATSITNWDRKEFIVPNREFITGRVLNWTLSDHVNRIVISVGVAYGSDSELARELLLKAANEHPLVLKDPPSRATFEGFDDNSLNFVLRTFLPSMENRLQVIHDLHTAIDKSFREASIEIAFPQRDLHIRSVPSGLGIASSPPASTVDIGRQEAA